MTSSESGRQRRHAKLAKRRAMSPTPSPLHLPSSIVSPYSTDASAPLQSSHQPLPHPSGASPPRYSPSQSSQVPTRALSLDPLQSLPRQNATREQLESQLHRILQRLGSAQVEQSASHNVKDKSELEPAGRESLGELETQLHHILQCLDDVEGEHNRSHNEVAESVLEVAELELACTGTPPTRVDTTSARPVTYQIQPSQSKMFTQCPQLQNRFSTLVRKASQLSEISTAEIYMVLRAEDRFFVYNSVDQESHHPPVPQAHETVVCVTIAGSREHGTLLNAILPRLSRDSS